MTRDEEITDKYIKGFSAQELSATYGISPRQIQRIVNKAGKIRTISESYILAIKRGRMKYYRKPPELLKQRTSIPHKLRYKVLQDANYRCVLCGATAKDGIRIEIDHIDQDATNNTLDNLQVLCHPCNKGKAYNM